MTDRPRDLRAPDDEELRAPENEDLRAVAASLDLDLSDAAADDYAAAAADLLSLFETVESLPAADPRPEPDPPVADRGSSAPSADPLNAVLRECRVPGADDGALDGYAVGVKDTVAVAGVETTCASGLFEDYVPARDATVVTRLLAAGADVTAKLNMDDMAASGTGDLGAGGPVLNPYEPSHLAGGSSGGSAAAVVTGRVDAAIGGDQGGSVRIPASWSGCVGLKPTHGLVPYTGVVPAGHTFDHVGPLARTVRECALVLDAVAGPDSLDPRQARQPGDPVLDALADRGGDSDPGVGPYADAAVGSTDPADVTVGLLAEGFDRAESDPAVDETVRDALSAFGDAGAAVETVPVPWHAHGPAITYGVRFAETTALVRSEGVGHFTEGFYDEAFARAFGDARRERGDELPSPVVAQLLVGGYLAERHRGRFHARAQNLRRQLRDAYDDALDSRDVLALPTTPFAALAARADLSRSEVLDRGSSMTGNTAPFDVTGHPAISVPCGSVDGLPVGLMLVGERGDDATVLAAAAAFESAVGWTPPSEPVTG